MEEERRLLFVGITRAREELQLSRAQYRDFPGARRMTVPSSFLMELPREEMEIDETSWLQAITLDPQWSQIERSRRGVGRPSTATMPAATVSTAARRAAIDAHHGGRALNGETAAAAEVSPDVFQQGMVVKHPEYGLGKIIALSGDDTNRTCHRGLCLASRPEDVRALSKSPLRPASAA